MEKSKLTTREELKTYYKAGKYPTQTQFAELIDSLRHKNDALSYRDIVNIANRLEALDSRTIEYSINGAGDLKFPIIISQNDAEDLVIELKNSAGMYKKQNFYGNAPYTIKTKKFPNEGLETNEYYNLVCRMDLDLGYGVVRLFGNNLPTIPDGFELGNPEVEHIFFEINKYFANKEINIVNTTINFINNTEAVIQYKAHTTANEWSDKYRTEDTVTDHYDSFDNLSFYFRGDLREIDKVIEFKAYNADNNQLLMTGYLPAKENNKVIFMSGEANAVRNIRIECDYH